MNKLENLVEMAKLNELLGKKEEKKECSECKGGTVTRGELEVCARRVLELILKID